MKLLKQKKKKEIENWQDKLANIRNVLKFADKPMTYEEITKEADVPLEETKRIIGWYFAKITKETTHSGFAHPDFYLFGDNVEHIANNFGYKVVKKRLAIGEKTAKVTRGHLR